MKKYQLLTYTKAKEFIGKLDNTRRAKIDRFYDLFEIYGVSLPNRYLKKKKFYSHQELHREWMKDPEYRLEYEDLEPEFQIAKAIIEARIKEGVTQAELAEKVNTGQAVISRLENMVGKPSISLIQRIAAALGLRLEIRLVPQLKVA